MKLREHKRIIFLLQRLETILAKENTERRSAELIKFFTDNELREMIFWLYRDTLSRGALAPQSRSELIGLIKNDYEVLLWTKHRLETSMTATPSYSQEEVTAFFGRIENEIHYLASKPVENWDEYDVSNYRSLLMKTGTIKKAFAIYTSDVAVDDVYTVTTKPSYFFDTKDEAELEITNIIAEGKFTRDDLVVHSLWLLT